MNRTRAAAAIAGGVLWAAAACRRGAPAGPEPGTDFYDVSADNLTEVALSAPARKLYAYRWDARGPFTLVAAGRTDARATVCAAGPGFDRWLAAVTRVPVVRKVSKGAPDPAGSWAELRLRDASTLEPITVDLLLPVSNTSRVIMRVADERYVTGVEAGVLRTADGGCAALGTSAAAPPHGTAPTR